LTQELCYTSAPRGLLHARGGFCTVAATRRMAPALVERLESLSVYRTLYPPQHPKAAYNPVVWMHLRIPVAGQVHSLLSRIGPSGIEHTGRSNLFAHHVLLDPSEQPAGGPAWLLLHPDFSLETGWEGEPRYLAPRTPPRDGSPLGGRSAWLAATGDAGWAAVLAESFEREPTRPVYVVYDPALNVLTLLAESAALIPASRRWDVTFSTWYTPLPPGLTCIWRCVPEGSEEARAALRMPGTINLCAPMGRAPRSTAVETREPVSPRAPALTAFAGRDEPQVPWPANGVPPPPALPHPPRLPAVATANQPPRAGFGLGLMVGSCVVGALAVLLWLAGRGRPPEGGRGEVTAEVPEPKVVAPPPPREPAEDVGKLRERIDALTAEKAEQRQVIADLKGLIDFPAEAQNAATAWLAGTPGGGIVAAEALTLHDTPRERWQAWLKEQRQQLEKEQRRAAGVASQQENERKVLDAAARTIVLRSRFGEELEKLRKAELPDGAAVTLRLDNAYKDQFEVEKEAFAQWGKVQDELKNFYAQEKPQYKLIGAERVVKECEVMLRKYPVSLAFREMRARANAILSACEGVLKHDYADDIEDRRKRFPEDVGRFKEEKERLQELARKIIAALPPRQDPPPPPKDR
jgi:hypothetical protein